MVGSQRKAKQRKEGGSASSPPPAVPVLVDASNRAGTPPSKPAAGDSQQPAPSTGGKVQGRRRLLRTSHVLLGGAFMLALVGGILVGANLSSLPDVRQLGFVEGGSDEWVAAEANGVFPKGCKWREVYPKGREPGFWDIRQYEYWDTTRGRWTRKQPASCLVKGVANPPNWKWRHGTPRTSADCKEYYCIYENLWFNNGRFYLLVDGPKAVTPWKMSRNQQLHVMHVNDARSWVKSVKTHVISGDTLIFDFVFFLHPTAIGHWSEMLFPLFSILRLEPNFARPPNQFVLLHLKKLHLMDWVRSVLSVTLGVPPNQDLPPIMLHQEVDSVWKQIQAPLEGFDKSQWVCFERALVVRDTFNGGTRTFLNQADARLFRQLIYKQYGLPPPESRGLLPPRTITFQRKRANRRVINEEQLVDMLGEFGEVRVVEFNASTTFKEQLETMAGTGVYISVHTSNLANSQFLPPGSAVVELIQRNWIWENLDKSFQVQTASMGDIHHFAWRSRHRNQTVYITKRDAQRFGDWPPLQCNTEECVEAHTKVDVVVNLEELRALLAERLPLVYAGYPVAEAAIPWPSQT